MKTLYSFLFFLCSFSAFSQNYNCFLPGQKNYFISGNNYVRGIRIDSVRHSGSDIIYFPYRTLRGIYGPFSTSLDTFGSSWVGKKVVQKPDGTFIFNNLWDTVFIKTQSHTGDSWIFYNDTSVFSYIATVTSEDTMTILGILDSVKTITITADSAGIYHPIDPVNNFQIILSKNKGFVQIFDLFTFPYHSPDTISFHLPINYHISNIDYYLDIITGNVIFGDNGPVDNLVDSLNSVFRLFNFHNPTLAEIYNFSPGDVYETENSAGGYPETYTFFNLDSVMSVSILPYSIIDSGSVHQLEEIEDYSTIPPVITNTFTTNSMYQTGDTNFLVPPNLMPEELHSTFLLHYCPHQNLFINSCDSPATYEIDVDYKGGDYVYNGIAYIPTISYHNYCIGFGCTYITTYVDYYTYPSQTTSLFYYYKNGVSCGIFSAINPTVVPTINPGDKISILPNPASGSFEIRSGGITGSSVFTSVYDMTGQCVFNSTADLQPGLTINTSSWVNGLYLVVVQDNSGIIKKEKLLILK